MKLINKYIFNFIFFIFLVLAIFNRPFVGIFIFKFRIGELLIALGLVITLLFLIFTIFFKKDKYLQSFSKLHILLVTTFFVSIYYFEGTFFNNYFYKSSSYIWTIGYIYMGFLIGNYVKLNETHLRILKFTLILSYILKVYYYPKFLSEFFEIYSDKFQQSKATDLLAIFVVTIYFSNRIQKESFNNFVYFVLITSYFLPLFIFMSKGSSISVILFFFIEFFNQKIHWSKFNLKLIVLIVVAIILFFVSSTFVLQNLSNIDREDSDAFSARNSIFELLSNKNTISTFFSVYLYEGRFYSTEGNLDWRLQIWQDVIFDLKNNDNLFFGYGFANKIPAMENPDRVGKDGENENVHNYFITVLARGGLFQLIIIFTIYVYIIKEFFEKFDNFQIIIYILPFLLSSMFDTSMESVQFPLIFFFFIGLQLSKTNDYY